MTQSLRARELQGLYPYGISLAAQREEMEKLITQIDPDLSDLIPEFLAHKRADTRAILSGVSSEQVDFEALSAIGHKLKGEGGSYGLDTISVYGAEIEKAARNREIEKIRRSGEALAAYLDSLQIEYELAPVATD